MLANRIQPHLAGFSVLLTVFSCTSEYSVTGVVEKNRQNPSVSDSIRSPDGCVAKGRALLGADAEVLVFGDLNHTGTVECVVLKRIPNTPSDKLNAWVSSMAILQYQAGQWEVAFRIIDDSDFNSGNPFFGAELSIVPGDDDSPSPIFFSFYYLDSYLEPHAIPGAVAWNPETGKYQEWD